MLGDTVRAQRLKKGLTQAKLARMAGVSRRHLAALEKGANVSVLVLTKVATVLDLTEIPLGDLNLRTIEPKAQLNVALVAESVREAREETHRMQTRLAEVEHLLNGNPGRPVVLPTDTAVTLQFPPMPVRYLDVTPAVASPDLVRDRPEWLSIETAGELRQGQPIDESKKERIVIPHSLIEQGEIAFRVRGDELRDQGMQDGDVLIVELRQRGRAATGELVIGRIDSAVYVGRWWQKHGAKALMSNGLAEVTVGRMRRSLKVVAAINQILRAEQLKS